MDSVDRGHPVQDQDTVEVVDFVLDGTGFEALRPYALGDLCDADNPRRPGHIGSDVRQAQTALPGHLRPGHIDDFWVDQNDQALGRGGKAVATYVYHRHPYRLPNLGRRQADAAGVGAHGLDQVCCECQGRLHVGCFAFPFQDRVWEDDQSPDQAG
jgi:hypothetical protein